MFAASIMNDGKIVGHWHMLQRISAVCALFLQHHRLIWLMCHYIATWQRE